jgi:hypothetical protein
MTVPSSPCPRCGNETDARSEFCKNCGFDAQANMMMPLFVSSTRRRLFWLAIVWLLAFVFIFSYALGHNPVVEVIAFITGALAIGASVVALLQRTPYSYEFFEDFVRVAYPSSFSHMTKTRIPYSTIDDFLSMPEGATTRYEFSVRGREGKFIVRGVTSYAGVDLSQWIKGRIPGPVKQGAT